MSLPIYSAAEFRPGVEGIFVGLPEKVYRAAPGVNVSPIPYIKVSCERYKREIDIPSESTEAMEFGTVFHAGVLEPEKLASTYTVRPDEFDSYRTKAAKEWRDAQTVTILTPKQVEKLKGMIRAVHSNTELVEIMARCYKEVAAFKKHPRTGLLLKGKADLWSPDNELFDFKKVAGINATREEFSKRISDMDYHQQGAHYCFLFDADSFSFIAVEEEAPHCIGKFWLNAESIEAGARSNEAAYIKIAECKRTGVWPGLPDEFIEIGLTKWKLKREIGECE